ncbi:hypothetical protein GUITHDRAFT_148793 [Guillardia theta CCMP2712]|uniref:CRC domain-containing protein n=1 Tax=Guillardia theta (strain CCMP2712) TaxID=905079 RepID=L1I8L2_GUITC|nr:hypothetical protein GUITHDRAFT_148793 [Guillardia theta CCMP2712]EKX32185.1 hypothetical protein GUITHDRAFT_148793 [Guillardia theta CCMP2712]|eukprot:XP_005819165.1 hypothetical protein GUITHDRAFT_148793 [Guillardia theta CCMP2712]
MAAKRSRDRLSPLPPDELSREFALTPKTCRLQLLDSLNSPPVSEGFGSSITLPELKVGRQANVWIGNDLQRHFTLLHLSKDLKTPASSNKKLLTPRSPQLQLMCFGENEVTSETVSIGAFGDFINKTGNTKPIILAGPMRHRRYQLRRSLEVELNQEEVCHLEGDGSSRLSYGSEFDRELSREDEDKQVEDKPKMKPNNAMAQEPAKHSSSHKTEPSPPPATPTPTPPAAKASATSGISTPPTSTTPTTSTVRAEVQKVSSNSQAIASTTSMTSSVSKSSRARDPSKMCKCKKSKCVRQYCVCFRAALLCEGCDCVDCYNDGQHEQERLAAIEHIKTSDPLAFADRVRAEGDAASVSVESKPKQHVRGCKCKNSKCLKKYCECFEFGVSCSSKCDCKDCMNGKTLQPLERNDPLPCQAKTQLEAAGLVGTSKDKPLPTPLQTPKRAHLPPSPATPAVPSAVLPRTPLDGGSKLNGPAAVSMQREREETGKNFALAS